MFEVKTTFIVGAGASHEVGLPVGVDLKTKISKLLRIDSDQNGVINGDYRIVKSLQRILDEEEKFSDIEDLVRICETISLNMSLSGSIDNYLYTHNGNDVLLRIAKSAIACSIIDSESESLLMEGLFGSAEESLSKTWYHELFLMIVENVSTSEIDSIFNNISIISFNYDRCIEHYLYERIKSYFHLDDRRASSILSKLQIFYPYGKVGDLPWQSSKAFVDYGDKSFGDIYDLSKGIITFSERNSNREYVSAIKKCVAYCHTLVFLGSAFHDQNIELIRPDHQTTINRIYGTAYGTSGYDVELILRSLKQLSNPLKFDHLAASTVEVNPHSKCADFLRALRRTLTAAI